MWFFSLSFLTYSMDLIPKVFPPRVHTKLVRYSTDMYVPTCK